jgi:hypothetical protein
VNGGCKDGQTTTTEKEKRRQKEVKVERLNRQIEGQINEWMDRRPEKWTDGYKY